MKDLPFTEAEKEEIIEEIKRGNDGMLKMLLIVLTRNLTSLIITGHKNWHLTTGKISEILRRFALVPVYQGRQLLPILSEVRLCYPVVNRYPRQNNVIAMRQIAPFFTIKSLDTFSLGSHACDGWYAPPVYLQEFPLRTRAISNIDLGNLQIENMSLEGILGTVSGMKTFHIKTSSSGTDLFDWLLKGHKDSLEVLHITSHSCGASIIPSLRDFQVLRAINLNLGHLELPGKGTRKVASLVDTLPASLELLKITSYNEGQGTLIYRPDGKLLTQLTSLVSAKPKSHPKLRAICIAHFGNGYHYGRSGLVNYWEERVPVKLDRLRRACIRHQVSLTEHQCTHWGTEPGTGCEVCPRPSTILGADLDQWNTACWWTRIDEM